MNSRSLTIGRASDNDLVISDGHISSHHARLLRDGTSLIIEDLNSSNHVYVDGYQVTRKQLNVGDSIQISYYYTLDWNHPLLQQWLSLGSGSGNLPVHVPYSSDGYSVPAPAVQWKGPGDSYCSSCGAVVGNGLRFCNSCGAAVGNSSEFAVHKQQNQPPVKAEEAYESAAHEQVRAKGEIPDRCPNCGSTNIRKMSVHKESKKSGGSGCSSCLLLIIIAILAPGLIIVLGVGGALGLAGVSIFVKENLEIVIPVVSVILIVSIMVSVSQSKTYVCGKCGNKFK
ncbi:MAG: FHA domain-containing protein [Candidatus Sabulitectum sp.]|nr:FHA domain-containing protein [Candidatus Sabulitectum sp.]